MKTSSRIIINTLATFGRSIFGMALSLFSARWILQGLGQADFGLYGVVGSIILLITFLNGGMLVGVARFYAYSIGRGQNLSSAESTEDLKRWFNTALSIHVILPFLLISIGYPLGTHAIENWLIIPPDRLVACLWVFRFSLITAFVSIFSVPFVAMYTAHQHISEIAFFGILSSCGMFAAAYFLLQVQADRLIVYAVYMMAINSGIPLIQIVRAIKKYKSCRLHLPYLFNRQFQKELFRFVGWKSFGMSCVVLRAQGGPILVNLYFGPQVNAAYSIANRLSIQATTLSTAMMGAFQPAITAMEGKGERDMMLNTSLQVCKFGTFLILLFVVPLIIEMDTVLQLWLREPPPYTGALCRWMLAMLVVDRMTSGHMLAVGARGKIAMYELVQGTILMSAVPLTWIFFRCGFGPVSLGAAFFITMAFYCSGRLLFCKALFTLPVLSWVRQVAVPVAVTVAFSLVAGVLCERYFLPGFGRVCLVAAVCGGVTFVLGWWLILNDTERSFTLKLLVQAKSRFRANSSVF